MGSNGALEVGAVPSHFLNREGLDFVSPARTKRQEKSPNLAIPPLIVAVTGLAFVPAMYIWTARRVQRERGDLERALRAE